MGFLVGSFALTVGCPAPRMGVNPTDAGDDHGATPADAGDDVGAAEDRPTQTVDAGRDVPTAPVDGTGDVPATDVGRDVPTAPVDAGFDVPMAPVDAGRDVPLTPVDAGRDVPTAPVDVGADVGFDVPVDAGRDVPAAVDVPTDRGPCSAPGQMMCGTTCRNTRTDPAHCGFCDNRCTTSFGSAQCNNGRCHEEAGYIALGARHSCTAGAAGAIIRCWGDNSDGQIGDDTTTLRTRPALVARITYVRELTAGGAHTCAHTEADVWSCWGDNSAGQIGDGSMTDRRAPTPIGDLEDFYYYVGGGNFTCSATRGGVQCWGANNFGQLGDGTTTPRNRPGAAVMNSGAAFIGSGLPGSTLGAGSSHACLLEFPTYAPRCWGHNGFGQLGDGSTIDRRAATPVVGITGVGRLALGGGTTDAVGGDNAAHTCVTIAGGVVRCWGSNNHGQLGDGSTMGSSIPVFAGLTGSARDLCAGGYHTCAVLNTGRVWCWGANDRGQLGDGTTPERTSPVEVVGLTNADRISCGLRHTCATADGNVLCWGDNTFGQLGDGTTTTRNVPTEILW